VRRLRSAGHDSRDGALHEELDQAFQWFDDNLEAPKRFSRSERRHANGTAISWFKDSAVECVSQLRTICRVLDAHGIPTEMLTSSRPGYIVFEDQQQVAAVPFSDTPT
jgi:hypothetical protein